MFSIVTIIVLLAINAFFVAAEFALVKARTVRIENSVQSGSASARLTLAIQENLESYLAACQLGITMASLGLGWVGEPAVAALLEPLFRAMGMPQELLHSVAFLLGFLLFSSLHIVIGEQVPKTLAIRRAEQVSIWVAHPLHWAYLLVWPLNWLLNKASRSILAWFNVAEATHGDIFSDAELKDLVSTSHQHGSMEAGKAEMLHNLLNFDQRTVAHVMIPRDAVQVLDVARSGKDNLDVVARSGHSRFPLLDSSEDSALVGVVLAKMVYRAVNEGKADAWQTLASYCIEPLVVPESQKITALFDLMLAKRVHIAVVVDEYARFVGIVTLEDLLEEIVGEIEDELDVDRVQTRTQRLDEGHWRADGLVSLCDLERETGLPLNAALDVNSIGGLVLQRLQRMPDVGDSVVEGDFVITVVEISRRRVVAVEIERSSDVELAL